MCVDFTAITLPAQSCVAMASTDLELTNLRVAIDAIKAAGSVESTACTVTEALDGVIELASAARVALARVLSAADAMGAAEDATIAALRAASAGVTAAEAGAEEAKRAFNDTTCVPRFIFHTEFSHRVQPQ